MRYYVSRRLSYQHRITLAHCRIDFAKLVFFFEYNKLNEKNQGNE
jgi:hypothetical protein